MITSFVNKTILFLSFQSQCLLFVALIHLLELPVQCSIEVERTDLLILVPDLKSKAFSCFPLCDAIYLQHRRQTQGLWAESSPPPCFIQPAPCFNLVAGLNSLPVVKELHLYTFKITFGPLNVISNEAHVAPGENEFDTPDLQEFCRCLLSN